MAMTAFNTRTVMRKIKYAILALLTLVSLSACKQDVFEEITELDLNRCLAPMGLTARVSASLGDVVTFSCDVGKDAESYILRVYTDAAGTQEYFSETVLPSKVPFTKKLEADKTYWCSVQAMASGKQDSKVCFLEKSFKTFAVKDNLFLKVSARNANPVSLNWSKDVAD